MKPGNGIMAQPPQPNFIKRGIRRAGQLHGEDRKAFAAAQAAGNGDRYMRRFDANAAKQQEMIANASPSMQRPPMPQQQQAPQNWQQQGPQVPQRNTGPAPMPQGFQQNFPQFQQQWGPPQFLGGQMGNGMQPGMAYAGGSATFNENTGQRTPPMQQGPMQPPYGFNPYNPKYGAF